ncbi:MAG: prepilin-type N-terminal cleavage/methylation domain-containing protein [Magnetococcales bacterium]|nr:prepilin-type N-terminal cleavage/methylation domain-containing protein [Magnetococcales bacterium]
MKNRPANRRINRKEGGFTLLELIIVVIVIGILGSMALPKFGTITDTAQINVDNYEDAAEASQDACLEATSNNTTICGASTDKISSGN